MFGLISLLICLLMGSKGNPKGTWTSSTQVMACGKSALFPPSRRGLLVFYAAGKKDVRARRQFISLGAAIYQILADSYPCVQLSTMPNRYRHVIVFEYISNQPKCQTKQRHPRAFLGYIHLLLVLIITATSPSSQRCSGQRTPCQLPTVSKKF
jgi:hypothetical protein